MSAAALVPVPAVGAGAETSVEPLVRMLDEARRGYFVPAADIALHLEILTFRARLLLQIQRTSPNATCAALGSNRNAVLSFLVGKCRANTNEQIIARMRRLGWVPE